MKRNWLSGEAGHDVPCISLTSQPLEPRPGSGGLRHASRIELPGVYAL